MQDFASASDLLNRVWPHRVGSERGLRHAAETAKVVQFIARELPRLSDAISVSYFAHSTISRTGRGDEK